MKPFVLLFGTAVDFLILLPLHNMGHRDWGLWIYLGHLTLVMLLIGLDCFAQSLKVLDTFSFE